MKKRSSLTSLRKDNEVKLEEEIIVCNLRDNDRESNRRVVDCNFKATSKREQVFKKTKKVLVIQIEEKQREGYKSGRRMPRLLEAMKDVVSCDKHRGTANRY